MTIVIPFLRLSAREYGLSFGEEGGGAFFHVFCGEAFAEGDLFAEEAIADPGGVGGAGCAVGAGWAAGTCAEGVYFGVAGVGGPAFFGGRSVASCDVGAFDDMGDGDGGFFVDDGQELAGL